MNQVGNIVNPYEFFGLSPSCSLREVSQAYYQMALLCHPDKGGSSESMKYISIAYRWIKDQIEVSKLHEKSFHEYYGKNIEKENVPNFTDILADTYGYTKTIFEEACDSVSIIDPMTRKNLYIPIFDKILLRQNEIEASSIPDKETLVMWIKEELKTFLEVRSICMSDINEIEYLSTIPHGYGDIINKNTIDEESYSSNHALYTTAMTIYTAPDGKDDPIITNCGAIPITKRLNDYTVVTPQVGMYDYEEAFKIYTNEYKKLEDTVSEHMNTPVDMMLQQYEIDRGIQDLSFFSNTQGGEVSEEGTNLLMNDRM